MKKIVSLTSILLLTALIFGQVQAQSIDELMASAQKLRDNRNEALALLKYKKVLEIDANHYEALWNASLLYSRVGNRLDDKEKQKTYFNRGKALAENAIAQNPTDAEGHYVLGVAMGRYALIVGAKERVAASEKIKDEFEEALRYNNEHGGAWHGLGRWNMKVANLSFAERAAANLLFGGLPEGASNENAIRCFNNSLKYDKNRILFMYDLATAYYYAKNKEKAKETLDKLIALPTVTEDDPSIQEEAKMMRSEL